jgi:hypothetical protein
MKKGQVEEKEVAATVIPHNMEVTRLHVELTGIRQIMFDRFVSQKEQLDWRDKVYVDANKAICLPAINIMSFLSAELSESAPQRVLGKGWKTVAKAAKTFVQIPEELIPFRRNGDPIKQETSGMFLRQDKACVKKGPLIIPVAKERPVLPMPWALEFDLELWKNPDLTVSILRKLFDVGGICIGFGTYRGVFGKFVVSKWDVK